MLSDFYCSSASCTMSSHSLSFQATDFFAGSSFSICFSLRFRPTGGIVLLTSACLCAVWHLFAVRGALYVDLLSPSERGGLVSRNSSSAAVSSELMHDFEAGPGTHAASDVQLSGADALCEKYKRLQMSKPRRHLQPHGYTRPSLQNAGAVLDPAGVQNVPLPIGSQPAKDFTFLFARPRSVEHVPYSLAHAFQAYNEKSSPVPRFNSSQIVTSSESSANVSSGDSDYPLSPESGASRWAYEFLPNGPRRQMPSEFYAVSRRPQPEQGALNDPSPADAAGYNIGANSDKNNNVEIRSSTRNPFFGKRGEHLFSQLESEVHIDGHLPGSPELTHGRHTPRQHSLSQDGVVHSSDRSQVEVSTQTDERRTTAALRRPSGFPPETVKVHSFEQNSAMALPQTVASPTSSLNEHRPPYSTWGLPIEAITGVLPALFGSLPPFLSSFSPLQILAERLLNRQNASVGVSASKQVMSVAPAQASHSSARPDQLSALTASQLFFPYSNSQPLPAYNQLVGIVPFLSELLTAMPLPHGVLGWLDPSGQKSPPWADASHGIRHASESYSTSGEIFPESASALAGVRSGSTPASPAQSARAESYENVWDYMVEYPSAVKLEPPPRRVGETTPLPGSLPMNANKDLVNPSAVLLPALPRPNRGGNMTAPHLHPRPSHSIPLQVLPTEHLRHIGNLDSDMAEFLDTLIQRIWRSASGPSSFMRVPPPLYSHRSPEGTVEEDVLKLEEKEQILQQDGQQEESRISTFPFEEDDGFRVESAAQEDGPRRRDFYRIRWIARSERDGSRPSTQFAGTEESSSLGSLINATLFPLEEVEQPREKQRQVREEQGFEVAHDGSVVGTGKYDAEFHKERARGSLIGTSRIGSTSASDEETVDWGILSSSHQNKLTGRKETTSISDSTAKSHRNDNSAADASEGAGFDPLHDPKRLAANEDVGYGRDSRAKSFQMNCSVSCQRENLEFEADSPVTLRRRAGVQGNQETVTRSQKLLPSRSKYPVSLSVQRVEYVDTNLVQPPRFPLFKNNETNLDTIWVNPEHPTPSDKVSSELLSSPSCSKHPSPLAKRSTYFDQKLSSRNAVRYHGTADGKIQVDTDLHGGCLRETALLTQGVSDKSGKDADRAERFEIPFGIQVRDAAVVRNAAPSNVTRGIDNGTLVTQVPSDVEADSTDLSESSAEASFQFFNAEQTARLRSRGDGSRNAHTLRHRSAAQKHPDLPSTSSLSTNVQQIWDRSSGEFSLGNPERAASPVSRAEQSGRAVSSIGRREARERQIPQNNIMTGRNTTLFWFTEAVGREEARQSPPNYASSEGSPPLQQRTALPSVSPAYKYQGVTPSITKQMDFVDDTSPSDETVELERPWHWEDTEEDFFLAFNGFPTPYDYYFPLNSKEEEDPVQQDSSRGAPVPQGTPADGAAGSSQNRKDRDNFLPVFPSGGTAPAQEASETNGGTQGKFSSRDSPSYRGADLPENVFVVPVGDYKGPALDEMPSSPSTEHLNFPPATEREKISPVGDVPLLSKLSSFFQSFPLVEWLRLDPTRVGPFDWKKVFGDLIPAGRRIKRAKELAHGVILNEYCNRTALESPGENASVALSGFAFDLNVIPPPTRIQSDFEKCVDYYRTRTREYIEEYRIQCQDVWGDPSAFASVSVRPITIDNVADCLLQKYDVGRRWFNELFYQPWYRLINQTSYLLQAVETAVTEFQYDAWFFPAAYSAANFGLWRACTAPEDCYTGEKCVDALPSVYNFTLSFCHHTPESMSLDPITGMPLAGKFS